MRNDTNKIGVIYCRVSSSEQVDNTSLESQERYCREYAKREGIEITQVFIEKGESAKTADRTELKNALSFCGIKSNNINYFIVYKLDRFARNQTDHVSIQVILKKTGIALRSATEQIDETPTGKVMEGILSVFAEFDNNVRTERSKGGMMEKVKAGVWVWQAPIGYYRPVQGSNIAPEPSIAPFIRLVFEEYAKGGYTFKSLSNYMNERGFRTRQNKPICMQLIEKILKNPLYCGRIKVWGLDIKGDFESIVVEELFARCQKRYKSNYPKMNRSIKNSTFPLRRFCTCSECNKSMTGSSSTGSQNVKYPYYHHHEQDCPKAKFIPKEVFEQIFVEYLNDISPNLRFEKIFKAIVIDIWQTNYKNLDENNARVRLEIAKLEQDRQRVFDLHRNGKYSDTEFQEQKDITNRKIDEKHRLLQDNRIEEFDMEEALNHCFSFIRETAQNWKRLTKTDYESAVRFQNKIFPEKITFDGEKFGTKKLSLIYKMNSESATNKSQLVTLPHPASKIENLVS
jgi:DNA invertase Pin-like site-specific DNA recombinase